MAYYFWKFIHNGLVHGLFMCWPCEPKWVSRLHDWTAEKYGHEIPTDTSTGRDARRSLSHEESWDVTCGNCKRMLERALND